MQNPNNLSQILRSFRKCGFSLVVVPSLGSSQEVAEWAIKAAALAHGYAWDGDDSGDDDVSRLIQEVRRTGSFHFDMDMDVSENARVVWAYAEELMQHAVSMTNEQVQIGTLHRAPIQAEERRNGN